MKLNEIKNYELPPYHDPENMPIIISVSGINSILVNSITVSDDQKSLIFTPTDFSLVGVHNLEIILSDE